MGRETGDRLSAWWTLRTALAGPRWMTRWTTGLWPGTTVHRLWTVLWASCGPRNSSRKGPQTPCGVLGSGTRTMHVAGNGDRPGGDSGRRGERRETAALPGVPRRPATGSESWTFERSTACDAEAAPRGAPPGDRRECGRGAGVAAGPDRAIGPGPRGTGVVRTTGLSDRTGRRPHASAAQRPLSNQRHRARCAGHDGRSRDRPGPGGARRSPSISCMEGLSSSPGDRGTPAAGDPRGT